MITKGNYYSQFESFSQKELQWKTCAISAIAMVLDAENKFDEFKNKEKNLESFLNYLVGLHKNGKPVYKKEFLLDGKSVLLTTETQHNKNNKKLIRSDADEKFFPVFNLVNGYDHRSSNKIFKKFSLYAKLKENITLEEIQKKFNNKRWKYFLASIHSLKGRGSHVVIIHDFGRDNQGRYIEIVDPAELSYELGIKRIDLPFFKKIFNGFGTFVESQL